MASTQPPPPQTRSTTRASPLRRRAWPRLTLRRLLRACAARLLLEEPAAIFLCLPAVRSTTTARPLAPASPSALSPPRTSPAGAKKQAPSSSAAAPAPPLPPAASASCFALLVALALLALGSSLSRAFCRRAPPRRWRRLAAPSHWLSCSSCAPRPRRALLPLLSSQVCDHRGRLPLPLGRRRRQQRYEQHGGGRRRHHHSQRRRRSARTSSRR